MRKARQTIARDFGRVDKSLLDTKNPLAPCPTKEAGGQIYFSMQRLFEQRNRSFHITQTLF